VQFPIERDCAIRARSSRRELQNITNFSKIFCHFRLAVWSGRHGIDLFLHFSSPKVRRLLQSRPVPFISRETDPIDSEVANDPHSTANAAVAAGFAGLPTAERFISNLEINNGGAAGSRDQELGQGVCGSFRSRGLSLWFSYGSFIMP
jgi:hypothetical protein